MGVTGFFAWILKDYKKYDTGIITYDIDYVVDILYLDYNCLLHPQCFKELDRHTNWDDQYKLESLMMERIMKYTEYLIKYVKPKKLLYISVDGVAPMAKMNQQRKRRYKSSYDNIIKNNIKKKHGKKIGKTWSNTVITPGTKFMERLHKKLKAYSKYIKKKYKIEVIYSSYHTPGEGEHKILQDIKKRSKLNKDNIYAIYGLDADLIFLALASKKSNIYLVREETHFGKNKNNITDGIEESLNYVSIDKFREYLNYKIRNMIERNMYEQNNSISKTKDFTDDFIFICYFLGNDFLPHLPSIDIKTGGLDFVMGCYIDIYKILKTSIIDTEKDDIFINMPFFGMFLNNISKSEDYYFTNILPKYKERVSKYRCPYTDMYDIDLWNLEHMRNIKVEDPIQLGRDYGELWRWRYYEHYYGVSEYQQQFIDILCYEYLKGIIWTTYYYFRECPTWTWQYSHLHAPFISDIAKYNIKTRIDINKIKFKNIGPAHPFVQLLSVLPPECSHMLPESYRNMMNDKNSPIIDMYPKTSKIEIDMINKNINWKCLPRIPHVNIKRIKKNTNDLKLNRYEKKRNMILDNFIYK